MATIDCTQCKRSFRTESGRTWHLAHIHQLGDSVENVDTINGQTIDGEVELLATRVDDLENRQ